MDKNILQNLATKNDLDDFKKELKSDLTNVKEDLSGVKSDLTNVKEDLSGVKQTLSDHSEQLAFIYENGATKEELSRVSNKLLEHDSDLRWLKDNMVAAKEDLKSLINGQDKVITMLERLDQERLFTNNNVERHEDKIEIHDVKIEKHETDINKIQKVLKLAH